MDGNMEEEVITTEGGLIEIPGTGVSLEIPPGALEEEQLIKMRIVLDDYQDELSRSFGSTYSSVVIELLPSNLKLQKPAKLTLPHCLVLKKGCEWKAKIYTSHHEEGNQPFWEEDPFALSELNPNYCEMWLQHFCWETFQVGNKIVEGKRIVLYAARSVPSPNKDAYVDVGFYLDLPGGQQAVDLKKEDILRKQHVIFYNKDELPLTIWFEDSSSIWTCSPEEENPKQISFVMVADSKGCFSTFVLKVQENLEIKGYSCYFKAGQGTNLEDLKFPLEIWRPPISKFASGVKTANIKPPPAAEETMETSSSAATTMVPSDLCSAHLSISRGEPQKTSGLPSDYAVSSTCPECIDVLQFLAQHITVEWQVVGRKLHLTDSDLETIMDDNKGSNQRCYKMLTKWMQKYGRRATYMKLGKALEESDRKDLQEYVYDKLKM